MIHIYLNPVTLSKIARNTTRIISNYPDFPADRHWQIRQMVMAVETGAAELTRYSGNGLVVEGWNGYHGTEEFDHPDPVSAWGGFYRNEPANQVAWIIMSLVADANDKAAQCKAANDRSDGYWLHWEDEPMMDGFVGSGVFYDKSKARVAIEDEAERRGFKRGTVRYSYNTGLYHVEIFNSVAKPRLKDVYRGRVPVARKS